MLPSLLQGRDAERLAEPGGQVGLHGHRLGLRPGVVLADGDPEDAVDEVPPDPLVASDGVGEDGLAGPAHAADGEGRLWGAVMATAPASAEEFLAAGVDLVLHAARSGGGRSGSVY